MNNPSNIKKGQNIVLPLDLDWQNFLVVGNWQYSIVHFAGSFEVRIGRPMFHHLWLHGQKCHLASTKGIGKLWLNFAFVLRWATLWPFLHTPSSCQNLQLRLSCFSVYVHLLWYVSDRQPTFSLTIWRIFTMFSSVMLVAGSPDVS
jgi:hypothetical protein